MGPEGAEHSAGQTGEPSELIATQAKWDEDVKAKKVDPKKDKPPRTYREFYMHNTSHWLGMDVHDVGNYKNGDDWLPMRAGCVLTVEPGMYIATLSFPKRSLCLNVE